MRPQAWLPPLVFLATAVPAVLLLAALEWGGDYRVWISIAVGVASTALAQRLIKPRGEEQ